jgi:hypothetical protein
MYETVLSPAQRVMVDRDALLEVHLAAEALALRHDLGPALAWVHDNASKLRRLGSTLEFALRRQEFIEIIRAGKTSEALAQVTAYLEPAAQAAAAAALEREKEREGGDARNSNEFARTETDVSTPHSGACSLGEQPQHWQREESWPTLWISYTRS